MTKLHFILASILLLGAGALFIFYNQPAIKVQVYQGDSFRIPSNCKHLALLGCTPHPIHYLKDHGNDVRLLETIALDSFLDVHYVRNSFDQTFTRCKEFAIDHLLIAYLPIYYIGMRSILGDKFIYGCKQFFRQIIPEITELIKESAASIGYDGGITLIIPTNHQLSHVPHQLAEPADRIRYLIKQFPVLKNISQSILQTITIINNKASDEDDMLINYLKYEYLYEKPIVYKNVTPAKIDFTEKKEIKF